MKVSDLAGILAQMGQDEEVVIDIHGRLYELTVVGPDLEKKSAPQRVKLVPINPPAFHKFVAE